jgi:phosphopantothenoylcysteine decarboxylase/phosphopantothenate--cysteine ligase
MIGFAAETEDLEVNALDKLRRKKLDMIVGNDVSRADAGFAVDTNIVTILTTDGRIETTPKLLKDEVADLILDRIVALRAARQSALGARARETK